MFSMILQFILFKKGFQSELDRNKNELTLAFLKNSFNLSQIEDKVGNQ